jgi:hypothetical protein
MKVVWSQFVMHVLPNSEEGKYSALHMKLPTRFGEIFWPVSVVLPDNSPREKATPKKEMLF